MADPLRQYLARYAEPESGEIAAAPLPHYSAALVLPVYDEPAQAVARVVGDLSLPGELLVILVANAPPGRAESTRAFMRDLRERCRMHWEGAGGSALLHFDEAIDLLLIDRASDGREIPARHGVGLARKIGADIALALIASGRVTDPFIYTTDADARLPADYFTAPAARAEGIAARLYPFRHRMSGDLTIPARLYELSLHYYVRGLASAGSHYAFHTVGSTIAAHALAYARVRGFPRRPAGEDFYLLNKLAKVGEVVTLDRPVIEVEARLSERAPFGTGVALARIAAMGNPFEEFLFYHPDLFLLLGAWLEKMHEPGVLRGGTRARLSFERVSTDQGRMLLRALEALGALDAFARAAGRIRGEEAFRKFAVDWFDAFRTLKLIHLLREGGIPSVPLSEVVHAPFLAPLIAGERHAHHDDAAMLAELHERICRH